MNVDLARVGTSAFLLQVISLTDGVYLEAIHTSSQVRLFITFVTFCIFANAQQVKFYLLFPF